MSADHISRAAVLALIERLKPWGNMTDDIVCSHLDRLADRIKALPPANVVDATMTVVRPMIEAARGEVDDKEVQKLRAFVEYPLPTDPKELIGAQVTVKVPIFEGVCPRCGGTTQVHGKPREVACQWGGCNGTVQATTRTN